MSNSTYRNWEIRPIIRLCEPVNSDLIAFLKGVPERQRGQTIRDLAEIGLKAKYAQAAGAPDSPRPPLALPAAARPDSAATPAGVDEEQTQFAHNIVSGRAPRRAARA